MDQAAILTNTPVINSTTLTLMPSSQNRALVQVTPEFRRTQQRRAVSQAAQAALSAITGIHQAGSVNAMANPSLHPQFRSKIVFKIDCKYCDTALCQRGMRAILLGDVNIELYSTDIPPEGVQLVFKDYFTKNCGCRIRDAACLGCGMVCGYHVTQPCSKCLDSCNNGHFWMFLSDHVKSSERFEPISGMKIMRWASLSRQRQLAFALEAICR